MHKSKELPAQQQKAYDFILQTHAATGKMPTRDAMCRHMGWKRSESAIDVYHRLRVRGLLNFTVQHGWTIARLNNVG